MITKKRKLESSKIWKGVHRRGFSKARNSLRMRLTNFMALVALRSKKSTTHVKEAVSIFRLVCENEKKNGSSGSMTMGRAFPARAEILALAASISRHDASSPLIPPLPGYFVLSRFVIASRRFR